MTIPEFNEVFLLLVADIMVSRDFFKNVFYDCNQMRIAFYLGLLFLLTKEILHENTEIKA